MKPKAYKICNKNKQNIVLKECEVHLKNNPSSDVGILNNIKLLTLETPHKNQERKSGKKHSSVFCFANKDPHLPLLIVFFCV